MPAFDASAILTRVEEVLCEGAGQHHLVAPGTYARGLSELMTSNAQSTRAIARPRIEVSCSASGVNPASPPVGGDKMLLDVVVDVRVIRAAGTPKQVNDLLRRDLKALALQDLAAIVPALEWPGNLAATEDGDPTSLASQALQWSGRPAEHRFVGGSVQDARLETTFRFDGIATVTLPLPQFPPQILTPPTIQVLP
jgi:hypothetical protein